MELIMLLFVQIKTITVSIGNQNSKLNLTAQN